jgi:two-component system nitrate/nitrite response regulator NarL
VADLARAPGFSENENSHTAKGMEGADLIRAVIVDDHPLARVGLAQILTGSGRIEVCATLANTQELADALNGLSPDVVVFDLYHAEDTPALAALAALAPSLRVLVVSASGRPADVTGAIRAGASGYITKHADPDLLLAAVETVAAGGFALSPHLADILHAGLSAPPAAQPVLSAREEQALSLIADGLTHAQVAIRMNVSKTTVETYVERIRAKLQVGNKAELARAALEHLHRE